VAVRASENRRIGTRLRRARVKRGIELDQAAKGTRITPRYLEALERDAPVDEFPAPVYARAFLREYAQWLGLDPKPLVDSYLDDHPEQEAPLVLPVPVQKLPGRWARRILPAISIGVLLTLFVVSTLSGAPPRAPLPTLGSPSGSSASLAGVAAAAPEPTTRGILLAVRVVEGPCWIRIESDGRVVLQTTMRPGSVDTFKANRRLDVWLGNAGAVRLSLNGKQLGISREAIYRVRFVRNENGVRLVPFQ
jgi:transcriptional regulator with XRE-family HTH domain